MTDALFGFQNSPWLKNYKHAAQLTSDGDWLQSNFLTGNLGTSRPVVSVTAATPRRSSFIMIMIRNVSRIFHVWLCSTIIF